MRIREATFDDYDAIWEIFRLVIQAGDTYVFDPQTPKADLAKHWFAPSMKTFVIEETEQIVGTYVLKPNHLDLGSHVANASYMVHPKQYGRGVGSKLCEHSIAYAVAEGFIGMQFNIVVSTNVAAIKLWKKFGFRIIGTTPGAFKHATLGYVDTHIMYRNLL